MILQIVFLFFRFQHFSGPQVSPLLGARCFCLRPSTYTRDATPSPLARATPQLLAVPNRSAPKLPDARPFCDCVVCVPILQQL